ncbi:MAG TPA: hypothetical protein VM781_00025 [Candidatus Bathyarchaeia archaeon]|nr:hypothetical protein [Candidatus Bathyarchaeia archaeon]
MTRPWMLQPTPAIRERRNLRARNPRPTSMVRTPSGHSPSQSPGSGGSGARSVLEPGDELGTRFLIDALLGEGSMGNWPGSEQQCAKTSL